MTKRREGSDGNLRCNVWYRAFVRAVVDTRIPFGPPGIDREKCDAVFREYPDVYCHALFGVFQTPLKSFLRPKGRSLTRFFRKLSDINPQKEKTPPDKTLSDGVFYIFLIAVFF